MESWPLDLWFALLCQVALGVVAAILIGRGSRKWPQRSRNVASFIIVTILVVFLIKGRGCSGWAIVAPVPNVLIWSDVSLLLAGLFCGLAWSLLNGGLVRRSIMLAALVAPLAWLYSDPLRGQTPRCLNSWSNDVCLQTAESTCSAAAAATLLRYYDVQATEQEMAQACLTRQGAKELDGGTPFLGLYRGLRLKTQGTDLSVEPKWTNIESLLQPKSGPWIISVGITKRTVDPIYTEKYGWPLGLRHSVILYGPAEGDRVTIGDPSVGREEWTTEDLRVLWLGDAIRLRRNVTATNSNRTVRL